MAFVAAAPALLRQPDSLFDAVRRIGKPSTRVAIAQAGVPHRCHCRITAEQRCLPKHPETRAGLIGVFQAPLEHSSSPSPEAASGITPTRQRKTSSSASSKPDQRTGRNSSASRSFQFRRQAAPRVPLVPSRSICYPRPVGSTAGASSDGPTRSCASVRPSCVAARTRPCPRSVRAVLSHKQRHGPAKLGMAGRPNS